MAVIGAYQRYDRRTWGCWRYGGHTRGLHRYGGHTRGMSLQDIILSFLSPHGKSAPSA